MNKIQKDLEKVTKIISKDYEDLQEFYEALMNYINDEGEEIFEALSKDSKDWFNKNFPYKK